MKKLIFPGIIILVSELFVAPIAPAQSTQEVSNLGLPQAGSMLLGSNNWIGQGIISGNNPGGYFLNSVQLLIDAASADPGGFDVSIYSSLNGRPESEIANLVGPDPAAGGIFTYTASGLYLLPSAHYFVVVTDATPVAQGGYAWNGSAGTIDRGNEQWTIDDSYANSPNGSSWTVNGGKIDFYMALFATPAPEPATLALAGLGLACLTFCRRKH
jgi:PEP-CTERM motif